MPRLLIISDDLPAETFELRLGSNRFGRSTRCDFTIEHPTVSGAHCDVTFMDGAVRVRDRDSTNGTFIDGDRITEAPLAEGQVLQLGEVKLRLESVAVNIAIPVLPAPPTPEPPPLLANGSPACPQHPTHLATYRCTHCKQLMCEDCVRRMRRVGGKVLLLCLVCSYPCEPTVAPKRKRRSLLAFLRKTLKIRDKDAQ